MDEDMQTPEEGFIFVLEKATLETAKVGKGYQILNCDDHANFLRRHGEGGSVQVQSSLHP